ncbi:ER protein Pkr1-domain-containing protein [Mrakia frigida]|uniref:Pkr1p n=1 Tax=Mrakia frigida TaxID=29902 RepID=UPI003FCC0B55
MSSSSSPSPASSSSSSEPKAEGFFADIISSVFDGGVNHGLILGMHLSFFGLLLVLMALYVLTQWNIHVLALAGVSVCLWASTGWFVMELMKAQKIQEEEKREKEKNASATGVKLEGEAQESIAAVETKKDI